MRQRILIIGCGGAGKSTLARQLGKTLQLPVIHLDAEFWQAGWIMRPKHEEGTLLNQFLNEKTWIIDGNYGSSMAVRMAAADTIIFLDFPRRLCLRRVLGRFAKYRGRTRPDMSAGCPEKLDWEFLRWIWQYRRVTRPKVMERIEQYAAGCEVFIFTRPTELELFLRQLQAKA